MMTECHHKDHVGPASPPTGSTPTESPPPLLQVGVGGGGADQLGGGRGPPPPRRSLRLRRRRQPPVRRRRRRRTGRPRAPYGLREEPEGAECVSPPPVAVGPPHPSVGRPRANDPRINTPYPVRCRSFCFNDIYLAFFLILSFGIRSRV